MLSLVISVPTYVCIPGGVGRGGGREYPPLPTPPPPLRCVAATRDADTDTIEYDGNVGAAAGNRKEYFQPHFRKLLIMLLLFSAP